MSSNDTFLHVFERKGALSDIPKDYSSFKFFIKLWTVPLTSSMVIGLKQFVIGWSIFKS